MEVPLLDTEIIGWKLNAFPWPFAKEGHEEPYVKMGITAISLQLGWTTLQNICDERLQQKSRKAWRWMAEDTAVIRRW